MSVPAERRLELLLGTGAGRERLTMEEVARDYKFPSAEAARKFVRRHVRFERRGRRVLVVRRDLDQVLAAMAEQKRRA